MFTIGTSFPETSENIRRKLHLHPLGENDFFLLHKHNMTQSHTDGHTAAQMALQNLLFLPYCCVSNDFLMYTAFCQTMNRRPGQKTLLLMSSSSASSVTASDPQPPPSCWLCPGLSCNCDRREISRSTAPCTAPHWLWPCTNKTFPTNLQMEFNPPPAAYL